tara:strand:- start:49 stop:354 length:306 start_codon:yes stop_codon:yes gene_type:complete
MEDYYINTKRKVWDFIIGFFGIWIISTIIGFLFVGIESVVRGSGMFLTLGWILVAILAIVAIVLGFTKGRRYISIGIISSIVLPLLIFGACWIVIIGAGGF